MKDPKFRIVKCFWRMPSTGKVSHYFQVQEWKEGFFFSRWRNYKYWHYGFLTAIKCDAEFSNEKDAMAFIKNMLKKIPEDKPIEL